MGSVSILPDDSGMACSFCPRLMLVYTMLVDMIPLYRRLHAIVLYRAMELRAPVLMASVASHFPDFLNGVYQIRILRRNIAQSDKIQWMFLAAHQKSWQEPPIPRRTMVKETLPPHLKDQAELQPKMIVMNMVIDNQRRERPNSKAQRNCRVGNVNAMQ